MGCDGIVESNKTLDSCGVCDGKSESCSQTKGSITTLPKEGKHFVIKSEPVQ